MEAGSLKNSTLKLRIFSAKHPAMKGLFRYIRSKSRVSDDVIFNSQTADVFKTLTKMKKTIAHGFSFTLSLIKVKAGTGKILKQGNRWLSC